MHHIPTGTTTPTTTPMQGTTTDPQAIQLHTRACNALATALYHLRKDGGCITTATARAIRAATALKRLSTMGTDTKEVAA